MNKTQLQNQSQKHIDIFKTDLGEDLAKYFVDGLYSQIGSVDSLQELEVKGANIFFNLAKNVYGPIMCSFVDWVLDSYQQSGKDGKILFMARDGIFLKHIAEELVPTKSKLIKDQLGEVYLTRKLAGESDEIAGFSQKKTLDSKIANYLTQEGLNEESLLVDMGLYGSLYNKGVGKYWKEDKSPAMVFFFSKNPNILGFMNQVIQASPNPNNQNLCNILVDGCECVNPQAHKSPGELEEVNQILVPVLEKIDDNIIQAWTLASLQGYKQAAQNYKIQKSNPEQELIKLHSMYQAAKKGEWNGLLPFITEEWSLKEDFLNNTPKYQEKTQTQGWSVGKVKPIGNSNYKL